MKMSDISNDLQPIRLTEAPEKDFDAKGNLQRTQTWGKAIKNKLKKHTPFNKAARDEATIEDETRKQAKGIKRDFRVWMKATNSAMTGEEFINFIAQKHSDLAPFATDVAVKLKMYEPPAAEPAAEPAADPKTDPAASTVPKNAKDDSNDTAKVDTVDPTQDQEDMVSPEELEAKKEESKDESVDMSASIYESRFRRIQLLERDLKDNDLDTLIVRLIQAGRKGGVSVGKAPDQGGDDTEQQSSGKSSSKSASSQMSLDDNEIENLRDRLDEFENDIKNIIRKQSSIDDAAKKELTNNIHSLLVDLLADSF